MSEVSCHVLAVFFERLDREGRPYAPLLEGVGVPLQDLRNRHHRISWEAVRRLLHNAGRLWTTEQLEEIGVALFSSPALRVISLFVRLLFTAPGFYRWVFEKKSGGGDQAFTCFDNHFEEVGPEHVLLELRIKPGYIPSTEFWHVCAGNFRGMPRALGLPPAKVSFVTFENGARYDVRLPRGGGLLPRIRRAAVLPFTAISVARELKEANTDLQRRYIELSEARVALASQTERLEIVNRLGRELAAHTDLLGLSRALTRVFSEEFPGVGLSVQLLDEDGLELVEVVGTALPPAAIAQRYELRSGEERIGVLWAYVGDTRSPGRLSLLDDLVPWISIALGNARSFTLLRELRDQLSRKVEERTAELNRTMVQLAESLEQQKEAIQLKTEFFDNVSHELRTPLTLILLSIQAMKQAQHKGVDPLHLRHLESIQRSADRLLVLINHLLDLARIGAGRFELQLEPVELDDFLRDVLLPFETMAEQKDVRLVLESSPGAPVRADPARLEAVVQNLVSNAFKFTEQGTITVRLVRAAEEVVLEVVDTGVGIASEDLQHIFERFAQADAGGTRRFGGTGIGLALVKELVQLHRGTIEVESTLGEGSTFRVRLPVSVDQGLSPVPAGIETSLRTASPPPPPVPSQLATSLPPPESGEGCPRILVVEDEPELLEHLSLMLGTQYEVLVARDGQEGLLRAQQDKPALIVSDVMMPAMSGIQMLQALRCDPDTADIPVLLLTARSDVDARVGGLTEGANDYVGKPFSPRELLARIDTQLRLKSATARLAETERLAAMTLLTSGFAHEVRNPLNGLMNALVPLKENVGEGGDRELADTMLSVIEEAGRRISYLAESLLAMVRGRPIDAEVPLEESVRGAIGMLQWRIPETIRVEVEVPEGVTVRGDPAGLGQVWVNLLDNALRAVKPGGRILIAAERTNGEVHVRVDDDGEGVPPETARRMFEPFFTTRSAGQGNGLGLSLCRRIVDQHRGRIDVDSRVGEGTRFTVVLPTG